ncbi:PEP-CTERM sorting domain-containing protein [Haloferula sargassicola]|uniref:PEP-CTERM protein-sorting domain-containing protein n=1 Tax=Haloferula sargassicola TaxID=490096 RepID=A0ABP9USQ2_9BACT
MKSPLALLGAFVAFGFAAASAQVSIGSDYYVRPYLNLNTGGIIDGLMVGGSTSSSQSFADGTRTLFSEADLGNGALRYLVDVNGPNQSGVGLAEFGDRLTFTGGAGTDVILGLGVDGRLFTDDGALPGTTLQLFANAAFAIFDPGVASWNNWVELANNGSAVYFDSWFEDLRPDTSVDLEVSEFLGTTITLASNHQSFDVFYRIQGAIATNENPVHATLDFSNTATASVDTAPGVDFSSESTVFLTGYNVPEPSTALCTMLAMGVFAGRRRRPLA